LFFGSQTGTAEDFAHQLAKEAKRYNLSAAVVDLEDYDHVRFCNHARVVSSQFTGGMFKK
jgi:sulfite reductase alpha subunit-like flavoprotein